MIAAGVSIKSGRAHIAVVASPTEPGTTPLFDTGASTRLEFNGQLKDSTKLEDLSARTYELLAASRAEQVGLVQVRAFGGLKYADVYGRVLVIAAIMNAANRLNIPFETHKTEAIGRSTGQKAERLDEMPFAAVGLSAAPLYWTTGLASAAAVAVHTLYSGSHV